MWEKSAYGKERRGDANILLAFEFVNDLAQRREWTLLNLKRDAVSLPHIKKFQLFETTSA
jgi:hypothetical protein